MDQIDTYTIKLIRQDILPALTHIINLSITSEEFPTYWKKSKIIPLHKKEDLLNPKNSRPVAIVSIFSKVLERVIFNQICSICVKITSFIQITMPTGLATTLQLP